MSCTRSQQSASSDECMPDHLMELGYSIIPKRQRQDLSLHEPCPSHHFSPTNLSHQPPPAQPLRTPPSKPTNYVPLVSNQHNVINILAELLRRERATFQRDILLSPEDTLERLSFCHTIADQYSFPGLISTLQTAIKTAESSKEHLAQRHLFANINCLTHMFIDNPKEGRSSCFRSRLITILDYCRRLCEQLKDTRDAERAGKVAGALDLVVLQIGRLTLDGVLEGMMRL